jgi:carbamoyl-phosphate synthase large subunit
MKRFNVLLTAGSRRVALVQAFRAALRSIGVPGSVIVTDVNPLSPSVHVADRSYRVPLATDESYVTELLTICEAEQVRLVVPTIDDELPVVAAARDQFKAIRAVLACSPVETTIICNDKYETCARLIAADVPAAKSYLPAHLTEDMDLPLFVKPRHGRGAVGAFPVRSADELDFFLRYVGTPIVQEYLDGPEFTIDVLCDFDGKPLSIVPRERVVIRAGVIDRGRTVNDLRLIRLAEAACAALRCADQPALLGRHPAHHPGRRRLPRDAAQARAGAEGRAGHRVVQERSLDDQL